MPTKSRATSRIAPAKRHVPAEPDLTVWPDHAPDPTIMAARRGLKFQLPPPPKLPRINARPPKAKPDGQSPTPAGATKTDAMIALMKRRQGATIADLRAISGWQPHSVRGAIYGAIVKKRGWIVTSSIRCGERTYRLKRPSKDTLFQE